MMNNLWLVVFTHVRSAIKITCKWDLLFLIFKILKKLIKIIKIKNLNEIKTFEIK